MDFTNNYEYLFNSTAENGMSVNDTTPNDMGKYIP